MTSGADTTPSRAPGSEDPAATLRQLDEVRRAQSIGVGVRGGIYVLLGAALFLAAWVGGAITESAGAPMLAIAVGYVDFARLERSWPVAAVAAVLGVAAVAVLLTDPAHGDLILTLVFGLSFTVTGLLLRRRDPVD